MGLGYSVCGENSGLEPRVLIRFQRTLSTLNPENLMRVYLYLNLGFSV